MARLFHRKVRAGAAGRRHLSRRAGDWRKAHPGKLAVVHSASAGEFEAALPIIQELKSRGILTAATLFSPSGYYIAQKYDIPDGIFYLPFDSIRAVRSFLQNIHPDVLVFCKHDIWPNAVWISYDLNIPLVLANANLHEKSFRLHPLLIGFNRRVLDKFTAIFTVSVSHAERLKKIAGNSHKIAVVGDSRFDRVVQRARSAEHNLPAEFIQTPIFICGSVWPSEFFILEAFCELKRQFRDWRVIWVPHEPEEEELKAAEIYLDSQSMTHIRFSELAGYKAEEAILVDKVGVLPPLYRAAKIAYVGGGFKKGVHSVIEPSAFALPVIFGPKHYVSAEAQDLLKREGGFSIQGKADFLTLLKNLMEDESRRIECGTIAGDLVKEKAGVAGIIADKIEELAKGIVLRD